MSLLGLGAGLLLASSLPFWLPRVIVALRLRVFTGIDGDEGIAVPGPVVGAPRFKQVYGHPAADGRSHGAALSDLFWYWLSPGPEMHQEHLEPGETYDEVARTTRHILALPSKAAEELTARCVGRVLDEQRIEKAGVVRLRDLMMPAWAAFYYELVFEQECPRDARDLIVGNANDVVTALKCTGLRHMAKRGRLTRFLVDTLRAGGLPHALPERLSIEERAFYLQGVFFNTAVVQMSEAMTHLLLLIAQHPDVQDRLARSPDPEYLDRVITEALRVYPLFGISHRITSAEIEVDERTTIPSGSVLCFNHSEFQREGFEDPERFDPDRWYGRSTRDANYIPFGVVGNRPCPAQALALITMKVAASQVLRRFSLRSSVRHTRSIPHRGPCLLVSRAAGFDARLAGAVLGWMRIRDSWEDVTRSVVQLVLGTYMVWEARRLRLCQRYFEGPDPRGDGTHGRPRASCPFSGRAKGS
jgi:hypothetical protein